MSIQPANLRADAYESIALPTEPYQHKTNISQFDKYFNCFDIKLVLFT